jgi:hypothetical protein
VECLNLTPTQLAALIADGWTQAGGPYDTEAECLASGCGGTLLACCDVPVANTLYASYSHLYVAFHDKPCTYASAGPGSLSSIAGWYSSTFTANGDTLIVVVYCNGRSQWTFQIYEETSPGAWSLLADSWVTFGDAGTTVSCDPFSLTQTAKNICVSDTAGTCPIVYCFGTTEEIALGETVSGTVVDQNWYVIPDLAPGTYHVTLTLDGGPEYFDWHYGTMPDCAGTLSLGQYFASGCYEAAHPGGDLYLHLTTNGGTNQPFSFTVEAGGCATEFEHTSEGGLALGGNHTDASSLTDAGGLAVGGDHTDEGDLVDDGGLAAGGDD